MNVNKTKFVRFEQEGTISTGKSQKLVDQFTLLRQQYLINWKQWQQMHWEGVDCSW